MSIETALIRIGLAILLGGIVGFERQLKQRAAGLRTHILVCLGASLVMIVAELMFIKYHDLYSASFDPTHMGAQVVSGIGFLGAGTIIYAKSKIQGLTTAASLWAVACIGLVNGAGFYLVAIISAVLVYIILFALNLLSKRLEGKSKSELLITIKNNPSALGKVILMLSEIKVKIENLNVSYESEEESVTASLTVSLPANLTVDTIIGIINSAEGVYSAESVSH